MMEEQNDFFSPEHERLFNIAYWAKILARVVLFFAVVYAGLIAIGKFLSELQQIQSTSGAVLNFWFFVKGYFPFFMETIIDLIYGILKGVVYYLVLKGVSLGLNMIVETDINYRDNEVVEGENG
jgi:hypothetical protein